MVGHSILLFITGSLYNFASSPDFFLCNCFKFLFNKSLLVCSWEILFLSWTKIILISKHFLLRLIVLIWLYDTIQILKHSKLVYSGAKLTNQTEKTAIKLTFCSSLFSAHFLWQLTMIKQKWNQLKYTLEIVDISFLQQLTF